MYLRRLRGNTLTDTHTQTDYYNLRLRARVDYMYDERYCDYLRESCALVVHFCIHFFQIINTGVRVLGRSEHPNAVCKFRLSQEVNYKHNNSVLHVHKYRRNNDCFCQA